MRNKHDHLKERMRERDVYVCVRERCVRERE